MGIERKVIAKLHLNAEDADDLCYAQLTLEIDWDEHDNQLKLGNTYIEIENEDEMELEVEAALEAFNEIVDCEELTVSWSVSYRRGIDHGWADELLGFKDADPTRWVAPPLGKPYPVRRMSELKVVLSIADAE